MANQDDVERLRRITGETDSETYTDAELADLIQEAGSMEAAASRIWGEKASNYADLVNMSEAGASRSNSDLFKHAIEQRDYFAGLAPANPDVVLQPGSYTTVRRIVRQ